MVCGFNSILTQTTSRKLDQGLSFNILVVGPTGIGKTTLIKSLFSVDYNDIPDHERKSTDVRLYQKDYKTTDETKAKIEFGVIETKGFDNQLSKSRSFQPILDSINSQHQKYLKNEIGSLSCKGTSDKRIHCCIYMISPLTGLRALDLLTMKKLHGRVCLIPVIGKSDILTEHERQILKEQIRQQIISEGIDVYPIKGLRECEPLAVSAGDELYVENSKQIRVRTYPWGRLDIEAHTDFSYLRDLVKGDDMLCLIEKTNSDKYENFRKEVIRFEHGKSCLEERDAILEELEAMEKKKLKPKPPAIPTKLSGSTRLSSSTRREI